MLSTSDLDGDTFDLVIVGGGPAGLHAAVEGAKHKLSIALIDERITLGGQIYKQMGVGFSIRDLSKLKSDQRRGIELLRAVENPYVSIFLQTSVLAIEGLQVLVETNELSTRILIARRILIAPGAYDRPVVFPGWTLPGVITAGGAQSMVKTQRVTPGKRILFAGSGPLALAFPAQLKFYGANVVLALEAGRAPQIGDLPSLASAIPGNVRLLRDAARYRWSLLKNRIPLRYRQMIISVGGTDRVEYAIYAKVDKNWRPIAGTEKRVEVDTVCVGYGFFPSTELFRIVGCSFTYNENLGGFVVDVDKWGQTSVANVFAAGDGAGVEGVYIAAFKARITALKIAQELGAITQSQLEDCSAMGFRNLRAKRRFQNFLFRMYSVGAGIYELADNKTTICRCESISKGSIDEAIEATSDISVVKAYTRAGMGLCQGRNCQRQIAAMIAQSHHMSIAEVPTITPRFPVKPVTIGAIADDEIKDEKYFIDA